MLVYRVHGARRVKVNVLVAWNDLPLELRCLELMDSLRDDDDDDGDIFHVYTMCVISAVCCVRHACIRDVSLTLNTMMILYKNCQCTPRYVCRPEELPELWHATLTYTRRQTALVITSFMSRVRTNCDKSNAAFSPMTGLMACRLVCHAPLELLRVRGTIFRNYFLVSH